MKKVLLDRFWIETLYASYSEEARYIGWDQVFSRKVVIWEYFGQEKEAFRRTAEQIQMLDGTSGLINVWKVFEDSGRVYAIVEYVGELSLEQILNRQAPWEEEQISYFLRCLQDVLTLIHDQNLALGKHFLQECFQRADGSWCIGYFQKKPEMESEQYDTRKLALCIAQSIVGPELWKNQDALEHDRALSDLASPKLVRLIKQNLKQSAGHDSVRFVRFMKRVIQLEKGQRVWQVKIVRLFVRIFGIKV